MSSTTMQLGSISVDVVLKDIKNIHLSVLPPDGRVRIAAPRRTNLENIRLYAISKLSWIKKQRNNFLSQERETPREYTELETHFVWGRQYRLKLCASDAPPTIELKSRQMILTAKPGSTEGKRQAIVDAWYRLQVRSEAQVLVAKWEKLMGVDVTHCYVQKMKTRWGSCNPTARTIRLNTDLARKPKECLEYIVVHEMVHIIEPTHNERFQMLLSKLLPDWQARRSLLNRLPFRHDDWKY